MPRVCEQCGIKMAPYRPRTKSEDGKYVCEGCKNGREGRPLTGSLEPVVIRAQAHLTEDGLGTLIKVAHGNMDGVTVFHCMASESLYWTRDGLKTLGETVNTVQKVLASSGKWVDAHIHSFGEQPLMRVTLRRNRQEKVLFATPEHRWIVRARATHHESVITTENLKPENRLASRVPKSRIAQSRPSQFGIAAGFVYGDGTRSADSTCVNLWGEKDAQMLQYFSKSIQSPRKTENGLLGTHVSCLPAFFKNLPSLEESTSYLYGWIAGYFAADGTVSKQGQAILHSASRENLEFVQLLGMRLGIATYDIIGRERQGYGDEPTTLYSMQFVGSTLRSNFFLTKTHRERFDEAQSKDTFDRIGWTVVSVEKTDRFEEVFCAVVPGPESFVLDGLILTKNCPLCGSGQVVNSGQSISCGFCHTNFSVLVQPQFPMMPQTVDGQPYAPGQPPNDPSVSGGTAVPPTEDDEGSFGGDQLSEKVDTGEDIDGGDSDGADDKPSPDEADKNPFDKESSLAVEAIGIPDYQRRALEKVRAAPKSTRADLARYRRSVKNNERHGGDMRGGAPARRRRGEKLLHEFGDGKSAPCSYCGKKLTKATLTEDKIYPHCGYRYKNVIPACKECNNHRSDAEIHQYFKSRAPGAKTAYLVTEEGFALPEEEFMVHLALMYSDDIEATLAEVQLSRWES